MNIEQLTPRFSVSAQINKDDLATLKAADVELIICNRPDNESEDQPSFAEIASAAKDLGMEAKHLPFVGANYPPEFVAELAKFINSGKTIHAYCRTGNRSNTLWKAVAATTQEPPVKKAESSAVQTFDVVIVGAGSAGIATASSLLSRAPQLRIALVDPAKHHYYQPGWTMVGGGVFDVKTTQKSMVDFIPHNTTWIQQSVSHFLPDDNRIQLDNDQYIHYQQLVVCPGLKLNWSGIEGLVETLGKNGVTSNYSYETAPYTWELIQSLKNGKAIFTQPPMPIKCAGAPQKAMYLASSHWHRSNLLNNIDVHFYNAGGVLFGVKDYLPALESYIEKYQVQCHFNQALIKVDGDKKRAWFKTPSTDGTESSIQETEFDMIHVCPPQIAPDFVRQSPLVDNNGWLEVNQETLQHPRYSNIWGLGDVINAPNAKTMAAARKQAPVVAHNITQVLRGQSVNAYYDGYGSCPLTVEHGKIVLAEFGYGGKLLPTFPEWVNHGRQATRFGWWLKTQFLPSFYWHGMLKGREWFVKPKVK